MRFLLVALLLATAPVRAQKRKVTPEAEAEARAHYQRGDSYYNLREYSVAVVEFKEAYAASGEPLLLFNIAQCYRLDKQYEEALHYYRTYLRLRPNAANRRDAEEFVHDMERLLATEKSLTQERPAPEQPVAPPPAEEPSPPSPSPAPSEAPLLLVAPSAPTAPVHAATAHKPLRKRWWVWTAAGAAVVVAAGVGLAVGLTVGVHEQLPAGSLGSIDARR
jgi:tetratricopeptide (TPR) repeat protein